MERFFDAVNSSEMAKMETMLRKGGVEYVLRFGADDVVREILVAEEDMAYAESLLASAVDPAPGSGMLMH